MSIWTGHISKLEQSIWWFSIERVNHCFNSQAIVSKKKKKRFYIKYIQGTQLPSLKIYPLYCISPFFRKKYADPEKMSIRTHAYYIHLVIIKKIRSFTPTVCPQWVRVSTKIHYFAGSLFYMIQRIPMFWPCIRRFLRN